MDEYVVMLRQQSEQKNQKEKRIQMEMLKKRDNTRQIFRNYKSSFEKILKMQLRLY